MNREAYKLCVGLLVFGLILTACASASGGGGELPDLGTIKVGYLPVNGYASFFLGVEKGYFEEQGLKVELERFDSGSKMIAPLSTGQLDVGAGEPGPALFNSVQGGLDIRVVCSHAVQAPGHGSFPFLVRKDLYESGEITKPADLRGKKIGVNVLRGMSEYTVAKVLEKGGLTVDDVELVTLAFPDIPVALANEALDAAVMPFPLAGKAIGDGSAVVFLGGDEIAGDIQTSVFYFGKRLLEPGNKEVAVKFLEVHLKALREIYDSNWSDEEDLAIISQYTNLPPEVIQSSVKSYGDPNCEFVYSSLEDIQNYYLSRGYVEYSEPLSLPEVIDESFAEEALRRVGEYQE